MKIQVSWGRYDPVGNNDRFIIPSIIYMSTYYCLKYPIHSQLGVKLFWGICFCWWNMFAEIRFYTGEISNTKDKP